MKSPVDLHKHHLILKTPIDEKFKKLWRYYIWQSFLAALALFIIVLVLDKDKMVVISSMGATAFIVFAMPNAASAHSRNQETL
jgi:CBS-domain-containing membrane protein